MTLPAALPDGVERLLAVDARQAGLLDEAVAAEALERLGGVRRARACRSSTSRPRSRCARTPPRAASSRAPVVRAREPQRSHRRGLGLDAEVGEHVLHQRLLGERLAEGAAGARRGASPARRACRIPAAEPSTQSSRVWTTISTIVRTPRPSSPTSRAHAPSSSISLDAFERSPSLSFSRWMRKPLRVPSGSTRGSEEAREARRRLGEHEERVAHRRRAEPLVPVEHVLAAGRSAGDGRVRAHVGAALALGHRHPDRARRASRPPAGGRSRTRATSAAAPTRRRASGAARAARARRRASSRSGTRGPPRPARRA